MEIEKAIGRLQMNNGSLKSLLSNDETDRGLLEKIEANNLAIQALEKQTGKKPYGDKSDERTLWKCPDCKYIFVTEFPDMSLYGGRQSKYCPECGQKIDWGDER